jgi:hypothetical protein
VRNADRQQQRDKAEMIAELVFASRRTQVHRHHGAHLDPVDRIAACQQVFTQRPGHTGQHDVVDRAAERLAHCLDLDQRHRIAPGHALDGARLSLEARRRIVAHQRDFADVVGHRGRQARQIGRLLRVVPDVDRLAEQRPGPFDGGREGRFERRQDRIPDVALALARACFLAGRDCAGRGLDRRVGGFVGKRLHDADQRDAVGDAVVDAHDHRRAAEVVVDELELPQRLAGIERLADHLGHQFLQFRLSAFAGQGGAQHMRFEFEIGVVFPERAGRIEGDAAVEARVGQ